VKASLSFALVNMADWHSASEAADPPLPAYEENGRLYHGSYKGMYLMPCDEVSPLAKVRYYSIP
jgi:hypothetical protein